MLKVFEALVDGKIAYEIYDGKNKLATIYNWAVSNLKCNTLSNR